jgi:hypothetical protein
MDVSFLGAMRSTGVVLCVLFSLGAGPASATPSGPISFENADIQTVVKQVAALTGITFLFDPEQVRGKITLLSPKRVSPTEALDLLVNPEWGWLGLEVKGGGVCRTDSAWSSTDREGKIHPIADPGRQAQRAVHAIRRYLTGHPEAHRIAFGWRVVLPDIEVSGDLGPELPRALIVDRRDLNHPKAAIRIPPG